MTERTPRLADLPVHASGLRLMEREHGETALRVHNVVELPECCPISKNPRAGSSLTLIRPSATWKA